jgi:uncharacterized heparinase superfamily protein
MMVRRYLRFWHTVRYMRVRQIFDRLWKYVYKPCLDSRPSPSQRQDLHKWRTPASRDAFLLGPDSLKFLGETGFLSDLDDWNHPERSKLWLYHAHYFEDLVADCAEDRSEWHQRFIQRWIDENPPGKGNGWEPYPLSLRISHWILWAGQGNELKPQWEQSLAEQVRWLSGCLEWHLMANHLMANAKAITLAGCWFGEKEGDKWLKKGLALVKGQIKDQILADGGHIERSAMYHCQVLNDLLDITNGLKGIGVVPPDWLTSAIEGMFKWLQPMCFPDNQIALFNDAAFGMAPSPAALREYSARLGLTPEWNADPPSIFLPVSGYARLNVEPAVLLVDVAPLGPDWLPAHGHADTLTFELALYGKRFIVDPGTSVYGMSAERLRQRGTAAHNTLCIDGQDSSEVWSGFRVGRRAKVTDASCNGKDTVSAAHNGYRYLGIFCHKRSLRLSKTRLIIRDEVEGRGNHEYQLGFLFHSDCNASLIGSCCEITLPGSQKVKITPSSGWNADIRPASWHPCFGQQEPTQQLLIYGNFTTPVIAETTIEW